MTCNETNRPALVLLARLLPAIMLLLMGTSASLAQETSTIYGTVVDFDGEPVSGATLTTDPSTHTACSGADGGYTLTVFKEVTVYRITARRAGYLDRLTSVAQTPSGSMNVDIIMEPSAEGPMVPACSPTALGEPPDLDQYASGSMIRGSIRDENGQPIAGATVSTDPATETVPSTDTGDYTIAAGLEPGVVYDVRATAEGYLPGEGSGRVQESDSVTVDLVMPRDEGGAEGAGWGDEGAGLGDNEPSGDSAEGGTNWEEDTTGGDSDTAEGGTVVDEDDAGVRVTSVVPTEEPGTGDGKPVVFEIPVHVANIPAAARGGNDDVRVRCSVKPEKGDGRIVDSDARLPIDKNSVEALIQVTVEVVKPGAGFAYRCRIVEPDCSEGPKDLDWQICNIETRGRFGGD